MIAWISVSPNVLSETAMARQRMLFSIKVVLEDLLHLLEQIVLRFSMVQEKSKAISMSAIALGQM